MLDEPKVQRSIARFGHSAVAHSNRMYVLGGFNGIVLGDMFVYEPGEICDIAVTYSVSPHFDDHSPAEPGLASTRMSPFLILLERRMTEVVVTAEAIRRAELQSNHHHQPTNTQLFYRPDAVALPVAQPTVSVH